MKKNCPRCGEKVEGVDLGDHPDYLSFACECGHIWEQNVAGERNDPYDPAEVKP